ncbi:MAG: mandelate racemase/muconate lactonizing enzyme family protein [Acidobacteriota bacterium]|nr:mandelate racemase/muconate lactonizing enzyme family protein [Acidobacteriota bacterium]
MKIDRVDVFRIRTTLPRNWPNPTASFVTEGAILLRVRTSDGLEGWGEPSPYGAPVDDTIAALDGMREQIEGRPLEAVGAIARQDEARGEHAYGRTPWTAAIAGLSQALWDLRAQAAGVPLYRLINPDAPADASVRVYASAGMIYENGPREQIVEEALAARDEGYGGYKFRPFSPLATGSHFARAADPPPLDTRDLVRTAQAVRDAAGPGLQLMLDAGCRLTDLDAAADVGRALTDLDFTFLEEPLRRDPALYRQLRDRVGVPIAGGECFFSAAHFREWVAAGALGVLQPDVNFAGIDEVIAIGGVAESARLPIALHSWSTAISAAANLHLAAAMPACTMLEFNRTYNPLLTDLLETPLTPEAGRLRVPGGPGLGVGIDERRLEHFRA